MIGTPIKVGRLTLANRTGVPPIVGQMANEDGSVSQATLDHYSQLATSGASYVTVEASYIHKTGQILPGELSIEDDSKIGGLATLAKTIKSKGIPAFIQLVHAGRMGCNQGLIAPSSIPYENRTTPREMSENDIETLKDWYRQAIKRAVEAGFDGVEIHCAHGYILSQFLSPVSNHRTDSWGGTLLNRSRLLTEVVRMAREIAKDNVLSVRLGACDCYAGGLKLVETAEVARMLEGEGVDLISVSIGITPSTFGGSRTKVKMGFVPLSSAIKKAVKIPVAVAGKITKPEQAKFITESGKADIVLVCRSLLADPKWPAKALGKDINPIIPCKSCKACVHFSSGCPK